MKAISKAITKSMVGIATDYVASECSMMQYRYTNADNPTSSRLYFLRNVSTSALTLLNMSSIVYLGFHPSARRCQRRG